MKKLIIVAVLILAATSNGQRSRYDPLIKTGGGATFVIAASDATLEVRKRADYVCDGTGDEEEINAAIQRLSGGTDIDNSKGGAIHLSEGSFVIASPVLVDRNLYLSGVTSQVTEIKLATGADCNILEYVENWDSNACALNRIERIKFNGNRANQTALVSAITDGDGTDDDPSVITKTSAFTAYNPNGLAGRRVYLEGTNCTSALYTIASNTANTITLISGENASSTGPMSNLIVDIEPLYGIYQDVGETAIDIRIIDCWFNQINGGAISLGKYWNHQISECSFENSNGYAITIRLDGSDAPVSSHVNNNFCLTIPGFIKVYGSEGAGGNPGAERWKVNDNTITTTGTNIIEIGGKDWLITGNTMACGFAASTTNSVFSIDTKKLAASAFNGILISNNVGMLFGSNEAKFIFHIFGVEGVADIIFNNNRFNGVDDTATLRFATTNISSNFTCMGNILTSGTDCILLNGISGGVISGNKLGAAVGEHDLFLNADWRNMTITGNFLSQGVTGVIRRQDQGNPSRLVNNQGADETLVTGNTAVQTFQATSLDSSGGAITATLPGGSYIGQIKTITMIEASTSSTITVTNHDDADGIPAYDGSVPSGDGEVGTFNALDETWILMWTGTEWTTLRATCTFV